MLCYVYSVRVLLWNESQQHHSVKGASYCEINKEDEELAGLEKDLIVSLLHVQSYVYDFHLRMIGKYLVGGTEVDISWCFRLTEKKAFILKIVFCQNLNFLQQVMLSFFFNHLVF